MKEEEEGKCKNGREGGRREGRGRGGISSLAFGQSIKTGDIFNTSIYLYFIYC
jgi:hypothetical protein